MPALKNKKHEAFARAIGIRDLSAKRAYMECVSPNCSERTAEVNGSALSLETEVELRISEFREEAAERDKNKDFLSKEEKRRFLARVVRTPVGEVDETSDLCQEVQFDVIGGGHRGKLKRGQADRGNETEGPPIERIKFKMVSKLEAMKIDNDLAVDGAEAGANEAFTTKEQVIAEFMGGLIRPGSPIPRSVLQKSRQPASEG